MQWKLRDIDESLDEATFGFYHYRYSVYVIASDGRNIRLGGSKTLEGAEEIGINQAKQVFENPWMTNKEKFRYLENMYIADDDEEHEVSTYEFDDYVDGLMSELDSRKDENLDINEAQNTAVDSNEAMVEELQNSLKQVKELQEKLVELNEKLSVSYAKESKLEEELEKRKSAITNLTKTANKVIALKQRVSDVQNKLNLSESKLQEKDNLIKKLHESVESSRTANSKLQESISSKLSSEKVLNEKLTTLETENKKLNESIDSLTKDIELKKSEYSKNVENSNKLVEKYKRIAIRSVDRYIESRANALGVTVNEIKNKLPESYNFKDIDDACESVQEYKRNISRLPFNAMLNENIQVKAIPSKNESLSKIAHSDADEIDDQLLSLAGLK